jgi:hypothetical protein
MRAIMKEVPRPFEVEARDSKDQAPIGREKVSPAQQAARAEDIMPLIAAGKIPLDEHSAQLVAAYLDHHHRRTQRER